MANEVKLPITRELNEEETDLIKKHGRLILEWKKDVHDNETVVEYGEERHWGDMCFGWLLAKGLDCETANSLDILMRYVLEIA